MNSDYGYVLLDTVDFSLRKAMLERHLEADLLLLVFTTVPFHNSVIMEH